MKKMKTVPCLSLGLFLCIGGCSMAPKYTRPEAPVPAAWPSGPAYDNAQASPGAPPAAGLKWREFFTDERLRKVIETALNDNRDLRIAALNAERTRALYGVQRAGLLPTVDATGSGSKQRVPAGLSSGGNAATVEQYGVNLGIVSWEIDFFGRIRSMKDAALREYLATEEARSGAQILLVSGVADAYLTFAADWENLKLARSALDTRKAAYNLIRRRYDVGLSTGLDLRQAQTGVDAARADVAFYSRSSAQDENALTLLVGSKVPAGLLPDGLSLASPVREVSPGMSSEVLLSRPDILQAENLLRAADADIGAARAALFPRISLTTVFGTASGELSGLFKPGSESWNFSPQIVVPIFDAGAWSALRTIKVEREIALARYERAIQSAFREVADALAARGTVEEQLSAQLSLVGAAAETYRLSDARYMKGVDGFLGVLDAQRSLYAAQQGLVSIRLAKLANQVRLYAVLGGGGDRAVPR